MRAVPHDPPARRTSGGGAEYDRRTDPDLDAVVAHEIALLDPAVRGDPAAVRRLLHEDFSEIGASGRWWAPTTVTEATSATAEGLTADDFRPARLPPDVVLLTCTARRNDETTPRSSVWVRTSAGWRLRHHQGTPR
ncbi:MULTISPECIES: DUF4440 domain-containing protein [Actinopolyspora]|uniref:DUF4440 domain-containing protein n=1 Tax=Actinopolyspora saharensis TaxID=995062 RepID=A0A1H1F863_9ACTN|nr:DUF4440 domain-containing protein [Actinopolyspora saharensis]NHD19181.1 DUF4440 domain-containing protein [Actinopolyspora sp. BKK2]NHE78305.1 DUF4440 domain-containing protein [Actinopolyspora sp. BKK1]SDQ96944.1 hypothetical protein SAMN04489718_2891 [Actinopolyspora saharensis]